MAAPNIVNSEIPGKTNLQIQSVLVTFSGASAGAATATEQAITVPGVAVGDIVLSVFKSTTQAGLALGNAKVTAANTVAVPFINPTAGAIVPTANDVYTFTIGTPGRPAVAENFENFS